MRFRFIGPFPLSLLFALGCASGKNASEQVKVRYEPPPELPPYEAEARPDPLLSLEALAVPEIEDTELLSGAGGGPIEAAPESGGEPEQATPVAVGGGAAADSSAAPLP